MVSIEGRRSTPIEEEVDIDSSNEDIPGLTKQSINKHRLIDMYMDFRTSLELEGEENLDEVRELHSKKKKLIFIGNHRSMIDAPTLERACEVNGYKDISDQFVFLLGQRVKQYPGTRFLSDSFAHIDVWPHTLIPEGEEVKIAQVMTRNSLPAVQDQLKKGKIIVIFAEGTRSRNGELNSFVPTVGHYASSSETFIVPFALTGTQNIWPVEKQTPLILKREQANVIVGEPFETAEFMVGKGRERYASLMNYTRDRVDSLIPPEEKIPYCNREE
jgi:1-acyl-sn-glycerol-3-phosphate acyltransferase